MAWLSHFGVFAGLKYSSGRRTQVSDSGATG